MSEKSVLQQNADKYIRFLRKEGLLTNEHALTVALIGELAAEWTLCTSSTQRAAVSKEIRAAIEMLPRKVAELKDDQKTFLEDLAKV